MRVSLILATISRTKEVADFLESLAAQDFRDFELVVVDQNDDDRLTPVLRKYSAHFAILHLRSGPGLSRARNVGLLSAGGDIVAFPDDDCCYPEGLLRRVHDWLRDTPSVSGLTGRPASLEDGTPHPGWLERPCVVTRFNVWRAGISVATFLRKSVVESVGSFDESLGVGAGTRWGSGEETDYLLRALGVGLIIRYEPSLMVLHPIPITGFDAAAIDRVRRYSAGTGRVLRKHRSAFVFVRFLVRSMGGCLLGAARGNIGMSRLHLAALTGFVSGWRARV